MPIKVKSFQNLDGDSIKFKSYPMCGFLHVFTVLGVYTNTKHIKIYINSRENHVSPQQCLHQHLSRSFLRSTLSFLRSALSFLRSAFPWQSFPIVVTVLLKFYTSFPCPMAFYRYTLVVALALVKLQHTQQCMFI